MTKYTNDNSNFGANGPFFHVIREGLEGLAGGEDYFDLLADDVVFEYVITVPGYPRRVEGRQNIIDLYRGYDDYMRVQSANNLRVYRHRSSSSSTKCTGNRYRRDGPIATTSSRSSRSRAAKSRAGEITSTPSPSLKQQGGPTRQPVRTTRANEQAVPVRQCSLQSHHRISRAVKSTAPWISCAIRCARTTRSRP